MLIEEIYCARTKKNANAGKHQKGGKIRPSSGVGARPASAVRRIGCGKICTKYGRTELACGAGTDDKVRGLLSLYSMASVAKCVCFKT